MYLQTDKPVAFDSPDHIMPWGTKRDVSRQVRYQQKIVHLMEINKLSSILDLGCSGGGYIADMHDLGFRALGIEGSDYSYKTNRGEWGRLKDICLFTGDITAPFKVHDAEEEVKFDVISAFEVLEHLTKSGIEAFFENISNCSKESTVLILSVSMADDIINGINLHQTVENQDWWEKKFLEFGWKPNKELIKYFNGQYLRGRKFDGPHSFEMVLSRSTNKSNLTVPNLRMRDRVIDAYSGSTVHKLVKLFVNGGTLHNK